MLPVLISLISLPLMYGLGMELLGQRSVAWLATALLALSPVDILFAQTARQYSLLTLSVIGSSWLLLRALRLNRPRAWLGYGLAVTLGLYGHVFFVLNWVSQGVFVAWLRSPRPAWPAQLGFTVASGLGLLLYSPWLAVLLTQRDRGLSTTSWASGRAEALTYVKFWVLSFTSLVVDSNADGPGFWVYLPRLPVLVLLGYGFWAVIKTATPRQTAFIVTAGLGPFLLLVGPDLLLGGHRSTITRYVLGAFPGVQLAMAYGLGRLAAQRARLAAWVWVAILAASLTSGWLSARADTWWVKGVSTENGRIASYLNGATAPLVVTDRGDSFLNKGNLLSLGYRLTPGVTLLPVSWPPEPDLFTTPLTAHQGELLAYRPSKNLLQGLVEAGFEPRQSDVAGVWKLAQPPP